MVGVRQIRVPTDSSFDSDTENGSTLEEQGGQEEQGDDKLETETWVQWIVRTIDIAESQASQAGVTDWVQGQRKRLWNFAGHTARRSDNRRSTRLLSWTPENRSRGIGRPKARWGDCMGRYLESIYGEGGDWAKIAQDRHTWNYLAGAFITGAWHQQWQSHVGFIFVLHGLHG